MSLKRSFAVVCFIVSICWAVTGVASSYSTVQSDILGALTQVLPLRGDYVPDLATVIISQNHIKPVKDEQGQWRYEAIIPLRRDLLLNDGSEFAAHDVVASYESVLTHGNNDGQPGNTNPWTRDIIRDLVVAVEAVDEFTVRFLLKWMPGLGEWQYGLLQHPIVVTRRTTSEASRGLSLENRDFENIVLFKNGSVAISNPVTGYSYLSAGVGGDVEMSFERASLPLAPDTTPEYFLGFNLQRGTTSESDLRAWIAAVLRPLRSTDRTHSIDEPDVDEIPAADDSHDTGIIRYPDDIGVFGVPDGVGVIDDAGDADNAGDPGDINVTDDTKFGSIKVGDEPLGLDALLTLDAGRLEAGKLEAGKLDTGRLDATRLDAPPRLDTPQRLDELQRLEAPPSLDAPLRLVAPSEQLDPIGAILAHSIAMHLMKAGLSVSVIQVESAFDLEDLTPDDFDLILLRHEVGKSGPPGSLAELFAKAQSIHRWAHALGFVTPEYRASLLRLVASPYTFEVPNFFDRWTAIIEENAWIIPLDR